MSRGEIMEGIGVDWLEPEEVSIVLGALLVEGLVTACKAT